MNVAISLTDRKLLDLVQRDFPICSKPYLAIAKKLKISENEVINKLKCFKEKKFIRSFAPSFDSKKIGFSSTLVAAKIPENVLKKSIKIINKYSEVTHNYKRNGVYNVWFTIVARNKKRIKRIIEEIKRKTNIKEIFSLPALKVFKISAIFEI